MVSVSNAELQSTGSEPSGELCIICSKPIRDHSLDEQKKCAEQLKWSKKS